MSIPEGQEGMGTWMGHEWWQGRMPMGIREGQGGMGHELDISGQRGR